MISAETVRNFMKETPTDVGLIFRMLHAAKNGESGVSYAIQSAHKDSIIESLKANGFTVSLTDEYGGYSFLHIRWWNA